MKSSLTKGVTNRFFAKTIFIMLYFLVVGQAIGYDRQDFQKFKQTGHCRNCDLRKASFVNQDLSQIDLRGADLSYADFRGASLYKANLFGAIFDHTDFTGAVWVDGKVCQPGSVDICIR